MITRDADATRAVGESVVHETFEKPIETPIATCCLTGVDFSGAELENAVLAGCELAAYFRGAKLVGADLRGADLRWARNLIQKQINKAYGSYQQEQFPENTKLPDDLKAPPSWRKPIYEQKRERGNLEL